MQTDNSYLNDKVLLRYNAIKNMKSVKVLDAFAGEGNIWEEVKARHPNISIIGIEKENKKNRKNTIFGDNTKLLKDFDLSKFNVIDLDAYGVPAIQLHDVLTNDTLQDGTYIFYTLIVTNQARLPDLLLNKLGYTKDMVDKIPTLFTRDFFGKFCSFLSKYGVYKVYDLALGGKKRKKHYGYFVVDKK